MKKNFILFIFIFFSSLIIVNGQENHKWKPLLLEDNHKAWYDASMVDTVKSNTFKVLILEQFQPPLKFDEIQGDVYRSKTIYGVDLKSVKYEIISVSYFNTANKEIYNFDYNTDKYGDNIKYTYPVTESSLIYKVIKELFNARGEKVN